MDSLIQTKYHGIIRDGRRGRECHQGVAGSIDGYDRRGGEMTRKSGVELDTGEGAR